MSEFAYGLAGVAGAIGFVEAFLRFGTPRRFEDLLTISRRAGAVLLSSRISEHWKEVALPAYSLALMRATATAMLQLLAAVAIFAAFAAAVAAIFGATLDRTLFLNWTINIAALAGGTAYAALRARKPAKAGGDYGQGSRALHQFALGSAAIREVSFDIDQSLGKAIKPEDKTIAAGSGRHVFVCSLARAGTSILFRTLFESGQFETLTYRDMPFVLAPRLWRKVAQAHGLQAVEQERAHKDGMSVSFDSPEAFEEVFWLTFAADEYVRADRLLRHAVDDETIARFRRYVAAILASSSGGKSRYLSKNNNNILRLAALHEAFPEASIVLPFRRPIDHATSLWRQHRNFCQQQTDDPFARRYMGWLGHYEFGLDFRPFVLGDDDAAPPAGDPATPAYWLAYWVSLFEPIVADAGLATVFFDYDAFCQTPAKALGSLNDRLGLSASAEALAAGIRTSSNYQPIEGVDPAMLARAEEIHAALVARVARQG